VNERESGNMLNEPIAIPRWQRPLADLLTNTVRTDPEKLVFATAGFEAGKKMEFIPWFRLTHERYNLYWQRSNPNG
jgi:hypothetical protein